MNIYTVYSSGNHVEGQSQSCPTNCPVNDCPVGFRKHLKTCLQESASSRHDNPLNISLAEQECVYQGGRLYQPRSTRTLNAASVLIPRAYDGTQTSQTAWGIHAWAPQAGLQQEKAIGMTYNLSEETPSLYYKDGSKVPSGLIAAKLNWATDFPLTNDSSRTCVTLQQIDQLSNNDCQFTDKDSRALSYICEARPFTTVEGPLENPGKACLFPFKKSADGDWHHSCVYDPLPDNKWNIWCPTKVDGDGVMVDGEVGNCDDERNTAYDGPDADNTCKLPFFYDGRWYENCTLYPRDDYWCATKVDPVTREMVNSASDWGFCPDHLYDKTEECPDNYDRLEDLCVRISPYRLSWDAAEAKCQTEGAHLLSILSQTVQFKLMLLIKKKESTKNFFEVNKWSTKELEGYWIGGTVRPCLTLCQSGYNLFNCLFLIMRKEYSKLIHTSLSNDNDWL